MYNRMGKWGKTLPLLALLMGIICLICFYAAEVAKEGISRLLLTCGGIIIGCLISIGYFLIFFKKVKLETVFVVAASIIGIMMSIVFTPYSAPDELAHIQSAYYYSNILLFQPKDYVRSGDFEDAALATMPTKQIYEDLFTNTDVFYDSSQTEMVKKDSLRVLTPFYLYAPATLGLTVGRLLNLGFRPILYLGTWCNLAFFIVCMWFSIKRTPIAKSMFFTIGLLPMVTHLTSSFSYDTMIIGLAMAFTAQMFYLIYGNTLPQKKDYVFALVLLVLLAPCKLVYIVLGGLLFLIPEEKFGSKKRRRLFIGIGVASAILFLAINNLSAIKGIFFPVVKEIKDENRETFYSLSWVLNNFGETVLIYMRTLVKTLDYYFRTSLGSLLAWFRVPISDYILFPFAGCLFLSVMPKETESPLKINRWHKPLMGFLCFVGILLVFTSMFFSWTSYAESVVIAGVQGRYFIPFFPLLLFLFRGKGILLREEAERKLQMTVVTLSSLSVVNAFIAILERSPA